MSSPDTTNDTIGSPVPVEEKQLGNKSYLWQPGQSGNPKGRPPKGHSITETIRRMMDEKPEIKKELAKKILEMAKEGDITAIKTLWNYLDGMPMQKSETDITTKGLPLTNSLLSNVSTNHSPEETAEVNQED